MLKPKTPPVRHRETAPRGSTTIDINITAAPVRYPAARAPARDAAATIASGLARMGRDLAAIREKQTTIRDGLARLQPLVEARKAARDAEARTATQKARCTPAAVQAANAARWSRNGTSGARR